MKKKLVVFTGAGISAESGVKTFRDVDGLWEGYDVMEVCSIQGWRNNRELMLEFYNQRRAQMHEVQPNAAHLGLVELEKDYDVTIITQNVDDLHERAGSTKVVHLHGELGKMCSSLNKEKTLPYDKNIKIGDKHEDGSQLRPYIVWFGEDVPMFEEALKVAVTAEIFVVVGSTLEVYPAASIIEFIGDDIPKYLIDPIIPYTGNIQNLTKIEDVASKGVKQLIEILK